MDATLRVCIGLIAAAVLMTLLSSGVLSLNIGGANPSSWLYVLVIGFIAGFSERFVPDLLQKVATTAEARAVVPPVKAANTKQAADAPDRTPLATVAAPAAGNEAPNLQDPELLSEDCACGAHLTDAELTPDGDLPPTAGGVALEVQPAKVAA